MAGATMDAEMIPTGTDDSPTPPYQQLADD